MTCRRCREGQKDWEGDDPTCAFDAEGRFVSDNWCCATMRVLRLSCLSESVVSDDHVVGVLPFPEGCSSGVGSETHLILNWYKSRGRTNLALVVDCNHATRSLALEEAERLADHYGRGSGGISDHCGGGGGSLADLASACRLKLAEKMGGSGVVVVVAAVALGDSTLRVATNREYTSGGPSADEVSGRVSKLLEQVVGEFPLLKRIENSKGGPS